MSEHTRKRMVLTALLFLNAFMFLWHIQMHCIPPYQSYFSQLTIIRAGAGDCQLHPGPEALPPAQILELHPPASLLTFSIETVAVLGFWALRRFLHWGDLPGEERSWVVELVSVWLHGGSYLTLFYIGKLQKLQLEFGFRKKLVLHLFWEYPIFSCSGLISR